MSDVFSIIMSLFSGFFEFLDSFEILNGVSFLKIIIVIILFYIALYFIIDNKKE